MGEAETSIWAFLAVANKSRLEMEKRSARAASFLRVPQQLAGQRPASPTCCNSDFSVFFGAWASHRSAAICLGHSALDRSRCGDTSALWLVDADQWNVHWSPRGVDCLFFTWQSWRFHFVGNLGRNFGNDRAWRMVDRRTLVRPEAFRDSVAVVAAFSGHQADVRD